MVVDVVEGVTVRRLLEQEDPLQQVAVVVVVVVVDMVCSSIHLFGTWCSCVCPRKQSFEESKNRMNVSCPKKGKTIL